jgi:N utilization substance protein B
MQTIYAWEQQAYPGLHAAERALAKSIQATYTAVLYNLFLFTKVAQYVLVEDKIRKGKHLPGKEDLNFSTKFSDNLFASTIIASGAFNKEIKDRNLLNIDNAELVRSLFKGLYERDEYKLYSITEGSSLENDMEIYKILYHDVMLASPLYEAHIEEHFANLDDDIVLIHFITKEFLDDFIKKPYDKLLTELIDTREQESFGQELFEKTNDTKDLLIKLIEPQLENWDAERVAQLDMILMRLALCEMLYFENIPVKVSINEYIDIAKEYSTPKSKDFINGLLDKLMRQFKHEGKIIKTGRGLVE